MTEGFVNSGECLQSNVTLSNYDAEWGLGQETFAQWESIG